MKNYNIKFNLANQKNTIYLFFYLKNKLIAAHELDINTSIAAIHFIKSGAKSAIDANKTELANILISITVIEWKFLCFPQELAESKCF